MASKLAHVELGPAGNIIRIFRDKSWLTCLNPVRITDRSEAVGEIRRQVFKRCYNPETQNYECQRCGRFISGTSGEMNEKRPKGAGGGKTGGEVSLDNCEALCRPCHQGTPDSAHGNRRWQTAKLSPEGQNGNY